MRAPGRSEMGGPATLAGLFHSRTCLPIRQNEAIRGEAREFVGKSPNPRLPGGHEGLFPASKAGIPAFSGSMGPERGGFIRYLPFFSRKTDHWAKENRPVKHVPPA